MKRRFASSEVIAAADGVFGVALDGKPIRTPGKAPLVVPSVALATAIAAEWQAQGDTVDPQTLPLTRLANAAIDLVAPRRDAAIAAIVNYAGTDLLCYRAEHPPTLRERQDQAWQSLLDWAAMRYGAPLAVTVGVLPVSQPAASLGALSKAVAVYDPMALAALNLATTAGGSLVLALALAEGRLEADDAFALSQLDETYEIERWGEDAEQARRRNSLRDDIALAARFLALLRA